MSRSDKFTALFATSCIVACMVLVGLEVGCAKLGLKSTPHPGAVSSFDSTIGDQLYLAQSTLEGLNKKAPTDFPSAIPALQVATRDFNTAENTYFLWRCAVGATTTIGSSNVACPVPSANKTSQADVQTAVNQSTNSLAAAQKETGK